MDMAPSIMADPPQSSHTLDPSRNLRNPLPLSASQEAQVRDIYYKKVRSQCAEEIKEFAQCAKSRTISLSWACKSQQFAMNSCMIAHAGPAAEDAAREEWFAGVAERRRKREEDSVAVEERRKQVIDMTRKQEEKERIEMEAKAKELEAQEGKKKGWWR